MLLPAKSHNSCSVHAKQVTGPVCLWQRHRVFHNPGRYKKEDFVWLLFLLLWLLFLSAKEGRLLCGCFILWQAAR